MCDTHDPVMNIPCCMTYKGDIHITGMTQTL